jgi:hypothetical protein
MNKGRKFANWFLALGFGAIAVVPLAAQNRPPKPKQEQHQERKQEQHQERRMERSSAVNPNRPPANHNVAPNTNRPPERARNQQNPNRPPNAYTPRMATPQERKQNEQRFSQLTPQQKEELRGREKIWATMTPEQRNHIKNDVMPKWQQLPPNRQKAIQSRLNVLQNMPESARNRHLDDPNFTQGMSDEDKAMLRDLAHQHVGGAPEAPHE